MAQTIILNGKPAKTALLKQVAGALANPGILAEKGGFLLKATLGHAESHLDVVPCIVNGTRMFHYDMKLAVETSATLIGAVDANGCFTIFFQPTQAVLPEVEKTALRLAYQRLAELLFSHGFPGPGMLDWSTGQLLEETGLFVPPPKSLAELVSEQG